MKFGLFATIAVAFTFSVTARADINPNFDSFGFAANLTTWNYTANITSDQFVVAGDFFTIYDFGNFIQGSNVQPTDWVFSSALAGVTPPGVNGPAVDDPTIMNLTWTYKGATTIPTGTTVGKFSVDIPGAENTQFRHVHFAGWGTRIDGVDQAGTNIANVGSIVAPVIAVPEPSSMDLLFGSGALALGARALRARFRRS